MVYILAIKLKLQKGKMTFWHRMALIFFRLWRKLVKMKFSFPWNLPNTFFLHMFLKTTSLLKGLPRAKLEVNPFQSLKYIAHFAWDLTQPWASQNFKPNKQTKKGQREVLNLRRETMRSLSGFIYVSVCAFFFFFLNNIAEVVNEF